MPGELEGISRANAAAVASMEPGEVAAALQELGSRLSPQVV